LFNGHVVVSPASAGGAVFTAFAYQPPMVFQACEYPLAVLLQQITPPDDDHIEAAQQCLMTAKTFPNQTLETISVHRPADLFARDRQSQTRYLTITSPGQYRDRFVTGFLRALEDAGVVSGSQKAHAPLEAQTRPRI
jgi:hypothetical protein